MTHSSGWAEKPGKVLRVGEGFRLADVDPDATPGYDGNKSDGAAELKAALPRLDDLQERLFAQNVAGTATGKSTHSFRGGISTRWPRSSRSTRTPVAVSSGA